MCSSGFYTDLYFLEIKKQDKTLLQSQDNIFFSTQESSSFESRETPAFTSNHTNIEAQSDITATAGN